MRAHWNARINLSAVMRSLLALALFAVLLALWGCAQQGSSTANDARSDAASMSASDVPLSQNASNAESENAGAAASTQASTGKSSLSKSMASNTSDPVLAKQLKEDIKAVAEASGMDTCIAVIDLKTGTSAEYKSDEPMVAASMIKLVIAAAFLEEVEKGTYKLQDTYTLASSDIVGGTGVIGGYGPGAEITLDEILNKMISVSDNTAANILIDIVGADAINAEAKKLGLTSTVLNRKMMDTEAIAAGIENYVSASDVAALLQMAYEGTLVSKSASKEVMQALEEQQTPGGIADGLPANIVFAHKTGALVNALHDGGIVEAENPFVIVVLCGGEGYYEQGAWDTMAQAAAVVAGDIV